MGRRRLQKFHSDTSNNNMYSCRYRSMRRAIIKPRSYLETPPISWIFSVFSIEQNKQLFQKVRSLSATKLGLNYSSW